MSCGRIATLGGLASLALACQSSTESGGLKTLTAPAAKIDPTELVKHGDVRTDDYFWLESGTIPRSFDISRPKTSMPTAF